MQLETLATLLGMASSERVILSFLVFWIVRTCSTVSIYHPGTFFLVIYLVSPLPILFNYIGSSNTTSSCFFRLNSSSMDFKSWRVIWILSDASHWMTSMK